jgi:ABC-type branched-subunit amino acid transport system substrate-binding protein
LKIDHLLRICLGSGQVYRYLPKADQELGPMADTAWGRRALKRVAGFAAVAGVCLGLVACAASGPDGSSAGGFGESSGGAFAEKKDSVKVALIVPLSAQGHPGLIGQSLKRAAELALFERDNPSLQLLVKDDKGTPEGAKVAAEEAVKGGATLILGPLFAKSVAAVAPVARQANVPVIAFSNDRQVAGNGVFLLSFQAAPEVNRVVDYAAKQGKRTFAALIPDDTFGKIVDASFRQAVNRAGGTIVALENYPASGNGALEPLRKISAAIQSSDTNGQPIDALFIPGAQENLELIGRLLPQAEIDTQKIKLIGTGGMDYANAGRDGKLIGAWYAAPDPRGWNDFSQKYAKSFGQAPPRIATLAYDAVSVAIALGSRAPISREALTRSTGFSGTDGAFRFAPDGATERALAVLEVQKFGSRVIDPANLLSSPEVSASGPGVSLFNFNSLN